MTKHEAALRALEEAYQSLVPGTWMNHAEGTLRVYWPTIRDALTAQGEAEKRLAGAAKLLVCGACGERPDGPAWRWAYGDSYRNGHIVGGPVPELCGPVVFDHADPAPSAPPAECPNCGEPGEAEKRLAAVEAEHATLMSMTEKAASVLREFADFDPDERLAHPVAVVQAKAKRALRALRQIAGLEVALANPAPSAQPARRDE